MSEFDGIFEAVSDRLELAVAVEADKKIAKINSVAKERIDEINNLLGTGQKLTVVTPDSEGIVEGLKHKQLQELVKITAQNLPILIVGMAGTGKTHAAEQVATALSRNFYAMSVGAQTSKSDILGFMHAGGKYVPTLFRKAYEDGGVFLMDEIDAGNANVLIQVNSALSNQYCAFPDKMVKRHKDFVFLGTANTYGNGANRQYVGRNQLDAATLDRFTVIDWHVDETLEGATVKGYANGERWHKTVKVLREYVDKQGIRALVTPRATIRGSILLDIGFDFNETLEKSVLNAFPADKHGVIRDLALKEFGKMPVERTNKDKRNKDLHEAMTPLERAKAAIEGELVEGVVEGKVMLTQAEVENLPF